MITSLDDFSRKILYADLFEQETTWAHIRAAEALIRTYGIPLRYYWIHCEYSASFKAEIASGDSTSCKLTKLTLNGDK